MFTHIMIGSNNLERSRAFYDATFTALGGKPGYYANVLTAEDVKALLMFHHAKTTSCGRRRPSSRASTQRPTRWNIASPGDAAITVG